LTLTLFITIFFESLVVIGYSHWGKKSVGAILITCICGNVLTQSLLWIVLNIFYRNYLDTLLTAEFFIWLIEAILLYFIPANQLSFKESIVLSLGMNALSFSVGWFLPI
jgi:hypothetical protein